MNEEVSRRIAEMENGVLNLERLDLTELPPLPSTVRNLNCNFNRNLVSLPPLHEGLERLSCTGCGLSSLPPLPSTLKRLDCPSNRFTSLPPLPPSLKRLNCMYNKLTSLPTLPESLESLNCRSNELKSLPFLPLNLDHIDMLPNPFEEPFTTIIEKYRKSGDIEKLIEDVNVANAKIAHKEKTTPWLQESLIAAKYDPRKIQRNMNKNQINSEDQLTNEMWTKYYNRRGEVWTEGVGKAYGPWKNGGKRKTRRKSSKRKTRIRKV